MEDRGSFKGDRRFKKVKRPLEFLDLEAESRPLSVSEIDSKRGAMTQIRLLEQAKKLDLKQKANIKWICDGDENTRFFHGMLRTNIAKAEFMASI